MKKIIFAAMAGLMCWSCAPKQETMETKDENAVIGSIMARRSIRHYTDTPVGRDTLQILADCGINAPNAMNRQEWEVRIVDSKEYFDGITAIMKEAMPALGGGDDPKFRNCFRNATAAIFIACPDSESGMTLINVGLMGENICLAAQSMGLGTCIMGGPVMFMNTSEAARPYLDELGFSEGYKLRIVIGVGHPDEAPEAKPRDAGRVKFVR